MKERDHRPLVPERWSDDRRAPFNEYNAQCAYCTATNPIEAERCCACARSNWRRP